MPARSLSSRAPRGGAQQKDTLWGPFWAARVLRDAGYSIWDGEPIDEDIVALRAGTVLPAANDGSDVPPGAASRTAYRHSLPVAPVDESGTSARGLAEVIEAASDGELRCVPLRGAWDAKRVERLGGDAHGMGARLIGNGRTGRLWGGRPPGDVLRGGLGGHQLGRPV